MTDDTPREDPPRRLQWGMDLGRDASTPGGLNTMPVFDRSEHVGDVELSDKSARVLMVMLADAVTDAYEPSPEWLERKPYDQLDDDLLDDLYDQLDVAQQVIAAYRLREQPETWQRQADEIGRLLGQVDDRDQAIARVRQLADDLLADETGHWHVRSILEALDGTDQT